jgi:hypothetical protein
VRIVFSGQDAPCGFDSVNSRHPNIHEDDVGPEFLGCVHCLGAIRGLADHVDVGLGLQNELEAGAHELLVVGDQYADGHFEGASRWRGKAMTSRWSPLLLVVA